MIFLPLNPLPQKPLFGEACNGCGLCCQMELCQLGRALYPDVKAPCPALVIRPGEGRAWCGIVERLAGTNEQASAKEILGIGLGCTMSDELIA